jgi:anthranilate synthase/aminodeoxychorismate synthase-like glutamine amidotransferase
MTTPRLLLVDNYDSFTYNLVQAFLVIGAEVQVYRNDQITCAEADALAPTHLCISPGPGTPYDAGVSMDMIRHFAGRLPIFACAWGTSPSPKCSVAKSCAIRA